ncbi:MAG TPA: thioredoxin family protein [Candidatus Hydrogenedentes bacterium]|nr:thioredoxin family protein [Candidatus Hydrogenedentota bacterium]
MPQPPILPKIDWETVFESGLDYLEWIEAGESPENQDKMENIRQSLILEPQIAAFLEALPCPIHVVAIAEDWCGDVVRHVPVLERLAETAPNLKVRYISRGQWPEVFVRFLTNGGEAIPKFIFLNETFTECGNWGPMPRLCGDIIARGKACGDIGAARKKVSGIYEADHNKRLVLDELLHLIDIASSREP